MKIKKRLLKDLYKSTTPELQTVMEAIYPDVFVKEKEGFGVGDWFVYNSKHTDKGYACGKITAIKDNKVHFKGLSVIGLYTLNDWINEGYFNDGTCTTPTKQEINEVKKLKKEYERNR